MPSPHRDVARQQRFLDYCALYGKVETALQATRLNRLTYHSWRERYPDFREQVDDALSWYKGDIRQTLIDAAFTRNPDGSKTIHEAKLLPVLDKAANAADYQPKHHFVQINHYVSAIPDNVTAETALPALDVPHRLTETTEPEDA